MHRKNTATLLLASMSLPSARQLAAAAIRRQWDVHSLDENPPAQAPRLGTFYGGTDRAAEYAARYGLCLIEPSLDLLARLPLEFLSRAVRFGTLSDLRSIQGPVFVKPADPIQKNFDPGVYRTMAEVRGRQPISDHTLVLVSDPVEWTSEFRCFIRSGVIEAWSPYLSYGRPIWKPACAGAVPGNVAAFINRFSEKMRMLPPAYVIDIGVLEDGRWAVVEFNPAWCSSILGANVESAFKVIERAAQLAGSATPEDLLWARLRPPAAIS